MQLFREFSMTKKRKSPAPDRFPLIAQVLSDLNSPEAATRGQAIEECWDLFPYVGGILDALRGLNDPDEMVRH